MNLIMPSMSVLKNLTFEEIGLLTLMLNSDHCDNSAAEELVGLSSDSSTKVFYVLNNLCDKGYIKLYNKKYFVNKEKIFEQR